jgi:exosortase
MLWAYWSTLTSLAAVWSENPNYSHGFLVPLFSAVLLWLRRDLLTGVSFAFRWWGIAWLAFGTAVRLAGVFFFFARDWFDTASLLLCLSGVFVLLGGSQALRWSWPAIAFLIFMIPLPYRLEVALTLPLQRIATVWSVYALQTLGFPALAEGNVILLNDTRIGVAEACSGLSMLISFFALSTALALVMKAPLLDKLVIVFSALPIGLVSNVVRITATGALSETVSSKVAHDVYHNWAGWLMMPLALGMLWIESRLVARLFQTRATGH